MSTTTPTPEKGNWNEQKKMLQAKFPTLTDADLTYEAGNRDVMFTKLTTKLGITRTELDQVLSSF